MRKGCFFIFSIFFLFSCEFEEGSYRYNMGADFITDPTRVIMIDTMLVSSYTTLADSVVTSRVKRMLAGRFGNAAGVVTSAECYFRLDPGDEPALHASAVFDSACIVLYPDGYRFGDTTQTLDLALHSLTEAITVNEESEYIYNLTRFAYDPEPLALFRVRADEEDLEPGADSIVIRFDDTYGKIFFDMVVNEDSAIIEKDLFVEAFKGFVIRPATDDPSFVMGFSAVADSVYTPRVRVYYHDYTPNDDLYFEYKLEDFTAYSGSVYALSGLNANSYLSNYISNNYESSAFNVLETGTFKLPASESGELTLIQAGVNLRTRIEIPGIDELYTLGIGSVIKAELYFEPLEGTFDAVTDLPSTLEMYLVDSKNRSYGQMYDVGGQNVATAVLHYNPEFKNQTYYSFDITRFLRDEYLSKEDPKYSLMLVYPQSALGADVKQLILGSHNHPEQPMKLKVYLSNY